MVAKRKRESRLPLTPPTLRLPARPPICYSSRDPVELYAEVAKLAAPPGHVAVLGLDLGLSCGYTFAWVRPGELLNLDQHEIMLGTLDLSGNEYDTGPMRFVRLRYFLEFLRPQAIFFEEVRYTPVMGSGRQNIAALLARSAPATLFFGGLMRTVTTWATERDVPATSLPIGAIKRFATGSGQANKQDMIRAAVTLLGPVLEASDAGESHGHADIADSFHVLRLGLQEYSLGLETHVE